MGLQFFGPTNWVGCLIRESAYTSYLGSSYRPFLTIALPGITILDRFLGGRARSRSLEILSTSTSSSFLRIPGRPTAPTAHRVVLRSPRPHQRGTEGPRRAARGGSTEARGARREQQGEAWIGCPTGGNNTHEQHLQHGSGFIHSIRENKQTSS